MTPAKKKTKVRRPAKRTRAKAPAKKKSRTAKKSKAATKSRSAALKAKKKSKTAKKSKATTTKSRSALLTARKKAAAAKAKIRERAAALKAKERAAAAKAREKAKALKEKARAAAIKAKERAAIGKAKEKAKALKAKERAAAAKAREKAKALKEKVRAAAIKAKEKAKALKEKERVAAIKAKEKVKALKAKQAAAAAKAKAAAEAKAKKEAAAKAKANEAVWRSTATSKPTAAGTSPLGMRYICYVCAARFYDLNRPEPLCPKCGADQREKPKTTVKPAARPKGRRKKAGGMAPLLEEDEEEFVAADEDETLEVGLEEKLLEKRGVSDRQGDPSKSGHAPRDHLVDRPIPFSRDLLCRELFDQDLIIGDLVGALLALFAEALNALELVDPLFQQAAILDRQVLPRRRFPVARHLDFDLALVRRNQLAEFLVRVAAVGPQHGVVDQRVAVVVPATGGAENHEQDQNLARAHIGSACHGFTSIGARRGDSLPAPHICH